MILLLIKSIRSPLLKVLAYERLPSSFVFLFYFLPDHLLAVIFFRHLLFLLRNYFSYPIFLCLLFLTVLSFFYIFFICFKNFKCVEADAFYSEFFCVSKIAILNRFIKVDAFKSRSEYFIQRSYG